jgi:NAD(P)H dehydrogenase (quinone)
MIIVTGATGKLGRHVIDALLAKVPSSEVAVAVRDVAKAAPLAERGVAVRKADYEAPASLRAAFEGAKKVLLISSSEVGKREPQHRAVIAAAREAKVELLAYTSILHADRSTLALAGEHVATEKAIVASGLAYAFLRNGWYLENYTENLGSALGQGVMLGSAGDGRIAAAARRDFAEAAVAVLTGVGHEGARYELAGDEAFTMSELAAVVASVAGRAVRYQDMPVEAYREALVGFGVPAPFAALLADSDAGVRRGELDDRSGDLRRLIGRPTTPLRRLVEAAVRAA